jgi:hypothetical protein
MEAFPQVNANLKQEKYADFRRREYRQGAMGQGDFRALMREKMCAAVRLTLMAVLDEELEEWGGAGRYERKATRRDHRIGKRLRDVGTSVGTIENLVIPRTRGSFQTQLFEKYQRRQVGLDQMIGDMFVQGVRQTRVGTILETLNRVEPSASTVSRVFQTADGGSQRALISSRAQDAYSTHPRGRLANRHRVDQRPGADPSYALRRNGDALVCQTQRCRSGALGHRRLDP